MNRRHRIWDVARHKIPGISEVIMMYNRPKTQDLIEAMKVIAKRFFQTHQKELSNWQSCLISCNNNT